MLTISPSLSITNIGKSKYQCNYKNHTIEYSDVKLNESRIHSIYENFNKIKYELYKIWFYGNIEKTRKCQLELSLELLNFLKNKDFFEMSENEKVLLSIIYTELIKFKKNTI